MNAQPHDGVTVCMPVMPGRQVAGPWGRAHTVALATVVDGAVARWEEHEVRWDELHDTGHEGSHHARIVRFLREHDVSAVAAGHMGEPMRHSLDRLGVVVHLGAHGDGEAAAVAAASLVP